MSALGGVPRYFYTSGSVIDVGSAPHSVITHRQQVCSTCNIQASFCSTVILTHLVEKQVKNMETTNL